MELYVILENMKPIAASDTYAGAANKAKSLANGRQQIAGGYRIEFEDGGFRVVTRKGEEYNIEIKKAVII